MTCPLLPGTRLAELKVAMGLINLKIKLHICSQKPGDFGDFRTQDIREVLNKKKLKVTYTLLIK